MSLKSRILLILYVGILLPLFYFWPKRWLHSGDLPYNSSGPSLFIFVGWSGGNMTGHHCQLLKSLIPSPPQPPLAPTEDGLALASLWSSPTTSRLLWHWEPEAGLGFGNEQTCSRVEGCTGLRWQSLSQISPYMKIRMLNRKCPRTITKSGPYHIYSAVVCFPQAKFPPKMSNALWLSPLHPWHCHQEEGFGPLSICQEGSLEKWTLEISFRCLNHKFLCLKRDF